VPPPSLSFPLRAPPASHSFATYSPDIELQIMLLVILPFFSLPAYLLKNSTHIYYLMFPSFFRSSLDSMELTSSLSHSSSIFPPTPPYILYTVSTLSTLYNLLFLLPAFFSLPILQLPLSIPLVIPPSGHSFPYFITYLPDSFLHTLPPCFLVRNPIHSHCLSVF